MIDLHLSAFAPRWRFLYVVRIDAYHQNKTNTKSANTFSKFNFVTIISYKPSKYKENRGEENTVSCMV